MKYLIVVVMLAGCGSFQDPDIVLDLRVLGMTAQPPEQVIDVSTSTQASDLLAELVPTTVCALVADPNFDRQLRWTMTMCPTGDDDRCVEGHPAVVLERGLLDDPDLTVPEPQMCTTISVDGNLLGVLLDILDNDPLNGLGGIDYGVVLEVGGEGADPTLDQYAEKNVVVSPKIPSDRTANTNPTVSGITAMVDGGTAAPIELHRCVDAIQPLAVSAGQTVRLTPVEPDGVRETYVVPTLDGGSQTFTESLTYQWIATDGSFSSGSTGGPRDAFGNVAPLYTDWYVPTSDELSGPEDVSLWLIQRDERFGEAWFESCVHVTP